MSTYQVLLIDLDNTIFDFGASEFAAFVDSASMAGISAVHELFPRYREISNAQWAGVERGELTPDQAGRRRFEILLDELDITGVDPVELSEAFQHGLGAHGELFPGAGDLLDHLVADHRLAMVTNGISGVQRAKIARLGLDRWFESIVISGEVGVAKPDAAMFALALDQLDMPERAGVLMVGDSLSSDIAGANAAGIACCWFNPDGTEAPDHHRIDHEIRDLDALRDVVRNRVVRERVVGKKETGAP